MSGAGPTGEDGETGVTVRIEQPEPNGTGIATDLRSVQEPDREPAGGAALALGRRLLPRLVAGLLLGIFVLSGLALFADARELGQALRRFNWWLTIPVLLLTCFNYGLRFVKWEIYLRTLRLPRPSLATSLLVYLSAFSMSITPGKVGEVIKALILRRLTGAPAARTTAVIAAERLTDGLAMLILAGIGLLEFAVGRTLLGITALGAVVVIVALQRPGFAVWAISFGSRLPVVGGLVGRSGGFFDASNVLMRPRLVVEMSLLGVVSWAGECVAFYLILVGLDATPGWNLLLVATFVLAVSSIFGAVSMLPGGLGVADASVAALLLLLMPADEIDRGTAAAATLLIRFATLWFAVLLGFAALAALAPRLRSREPLASDQPTSDRAKGYVHR